MQTTAAIQGRHRPLAKTARGKIFSQGQTLCLRMNVMAWCHVTHACDCPSHRPELFMLRLHCMTVLCYLAAFPSLPPAWHSPHPQAHLHHARSHYPLRTLGTELLARFCSGMEPVGELQRRLVVLEQRHADLRRIVHLLATHHTPPPDPAHIPLPVFKPSPKPAAHSSLNCYTPSAALFIGSVLHL